MHYQKNLPSQFAKHLEALFPKRDIKRALEADQGLDFEQYQSDPVGFGEQVLGEIYTEDVKRMMESVRDNLDTVARSCNQEGKTHAAARVAVWWYKCFPDSQVYTAAAPPENNLVRLLWGEIGNIINAHPELFKEDEIKRLFLSRPTSVRGTEATHFIAGVTIPPSGSEDVREAKFRGKHAPHLLFIFDESNAIPDEVFKGSDACMSGGHVRRLSMHNPNRQEGAVYRMERDGTANVVKLSALNHPNVVQGQEVIPGAVDRETVVRRINQWCRPLNETERPDSECFELPEFLTGETATNPGGGEFPPLQPGHYKVMTAEFSYMVLGEYPGQTSNQLISREWINNARTRWDLYVQEHGEVPPAGTQPVMGLDVAEEGKDLNFACLRHGGYVERPSPETVWSGLDVLQTGDKAAQIYKTRNAYKANTDATGVGSGVAPQMRRNGCRANAIKVSERATRKTELGTFRHLRDQIWWETREWLRTDPAAMLPPDEMMIEELQVATYEVKDGKIKVMSSDTMRELLKRSPDKAVGLTLTFAPSGFFDGCDFS